MVFFGTPLFAAEILQYLFERQVDIRAVVTQPDRPKGRSLAVSPTPVKEVLLKQPLLIPIFQPEKASEEGFLS
ncbi:MAG: methionyl-tRNA formyltransferase, partial [Chlamydiota bacterium]